MSVKSSYLTEMPLIVRSVLKGQMSPLNFLLLLGFFSSLVLLYISLHFHFFTISQEISENRERAALLMDRNVRLTALYNDLISPGRIIPIAHEFGMRAGLPDEVRRIALYEGRKLNRMEEAGLAQAGAGDDLEERPGIDPEAK